MSEKMKLYMIMLGCKPKGRTTEQHDIFFGISTSMKNLIPQMNAFWPEANGAMHVDAWREVNAVDGFQISVIPKGTITEPKQQLFFINLGGYKPGEFEEFHYKIITVASSLAEAVKKSKATAFYKHCGFTGAVSHIDDKYGIDVDDIYKVDDILAADLKIAFQLEITPNVNLPEDKLNIGYFKLSKL